MTDGQKVAFVDAAYNIGIHVFYGSNVARRANAGDMARGCDVLLMWNNVDGSVVHGLTLRRKTEREIYGACRDPAPCLALAAGLAVLAIGQAAAGSVANGSRLTARYCAPCQHRPARRPTGRRQGIRTPA